MINWLIKLEQRTITMTDAHSLHFHQQTIRRNIWNWDTRTERFAVAHFGDPGVHFGREGHFSLLLMMDGCAGYRQLVVMREEDARDECFQT